MKRIMDTYLKQNRQIRHTVIFCIFTIGLFSTVGTIQAEEIIIGNTFGLSARSIGMGGASLGLADDFTALYWNPAGMAQIRKFELFSSVSYNTEDTNTYFDNQAATSISQTQTHPNSVGFVYPFEVSQGSIAIAFGYNHPQNFDDSRAIQGIDPGLGTEFSGFAVDETGINSGRIGIWSFGISTFVTNQILIGSSLDFWQGQSLNELDVTATDIMNVDESLARFRYDDEVDREYSGVGSRIGMLVHLTDAISLGLTLFLPFDLSVDELWTQQNYLFYDNGQEELESQSGEQTFDIKRSFEIGTGIAVKLLNKRLILAGDIQISDWTQTRYAPAPADNIPQDYFEKFYSNTFQGRLGAEYRIPEIDTHIRLGYFRDTIPFMKADVENERDFLTVGIGKTFEDALKLDFAYMWGNWQWHRNAVTVERFSHRGFVSAAYRF